MVEKSVGVCAGLEGKFFIIEKIKKSGDVVDNKLCSALYVDTFEQAQEVQTAIKALGIGDAIVPRGRPRRPPRYARQGRRVGTNARLRSAALTAEHVARHLL